MNQLQTPTVYIKTYWKVARQSLDSVSLGFNEELSKVKVQIMQNTLMPVTKKSIAKRNSSALMFKMNEEMHSQKQGLIDWICFSLKFGAMDENLSMKDNCHSLEDYSRVHHISLHKKGVMDKFAKF